MSTDLHDAARRNNLEDIRAIYDQDEVVDVLDKEKKTPLWYAADEGYFHACELLLALGATIMPGYHSALDTAIKRGHAHIVELLWPHCSGEPDFCTLENAISLGFHTIADFLLESGDFLQSPSQNNQEFEAYGFPGRGCEVFQQWERFFFARREQHLRMNPLFLPRRQQTMVEHA